MFSYICCYIGVLLPPTPEVGVQIPTSVCVCLDTLFNCGLPEFWPTKTWETPPVVSLRLYQYTTYSPVVQCAFRQLLKIKICSGLFY